MKTRRYAVFGKCTLYLSDLSQDRTSLLTIAAGLRNRIYKFVLVEPTGHVQVTKDLK